MKMEEARIAAHVCGDGWLGTYTEKNSLQIVNGRRYFRERIRYEIGYSNNEKFLLVQFKKDVGSVFGVKAQLREKEVRFRSKRIFDRLSSLGAGKSRDWFIGKEIFNSNKTVKKEWLKAFFDDEATSNPGMYHGSIRIKSVNLNGLKQVLLLLRDFGIESHITGKNIDDTWYLNLNKKDAKLYSRKIGFDHPIKNLKLRSYFK